MRTRGVREDTGIVTISTANRYRAAREVFEIEAYWRGWAPRAEQRQAGLRGDVA